MTYFLCRACCPPRPFEEKSLGWAPPRACEACGATVQTPDGGAFPSEPPRIALMQIIARLRGNPAHVGAKEVAVREKCSWSHSVNSEGCLQVDVRLPDPKRTSTGTEIISSAGVVLTREASVRLARLVLALEARPPASGPR